MGKQRLGSLKEIAPDKWGLQIAWRCKVTGKRKAFSDVFYGTQNDAEMHRQSCLEQLKSVEYQAKPFKLKTQTQIEKRRLKIQRAERVIESLTKNIPQNDWKSVFHNAKKNAKLRNKAFELTFEEFFKLVDLSEGRCTISKIPFSLDKFPNSFRRPFAPSLDRIDCSKGYTLLNCRLVCVAVNVAMNEWGEGVLLAIATSIVNSE